MTALQETTAATLATTEGTLAETQTALADMTALQEATAAALATTEDTLAETQTALADMTALQATTAATLLSTEGTLAETTTALAAVTALQETTAAQLATTETELSDAKTQIIEANYQHAQSLMAVNDYIGAHAMFLTVKGYKDADDLLATNAHLKAAPEYDAAYQPGNYVTFGSCAQTRAGRDDTPIEWLVLERDGSKALLISRYALAGLPYNMDYTETTWAQCSLREWLNGAVVNVVFDGDEKAAILTTHVTADKNPDHSTDPGKVTQDKVFLLSIEEVEKYFTTEEARVCKPTAYAKAKDPRAQSAYCNWWLRSPGKNQAQAAYVLENGSISTSGINVNYSAGIPGIRPALWVDVNLVNLAYEADEPETPVDAE